MAAVTDRRRIPDTFALVTWPRLLVHLRPERDQERKALNSQINVLAKKARARTITPAESETLIRLRRQHQELGRKLMAVTKNREFDPLALSRSRSAGKR